MKQFEHAHKVLAILSLLCILILSPSGLLAQSNSTAKRNIFDALESSRSGEGNVEIQQSAQVRASVGNVSTSSKILTGEPGTVRVMQGYRVQVYNGNLASSKHEANNRAAQITSFDPTMTCYLTYKAPFWRLLVGDYATREDAELARQTLRAAFPNYAREIYIVRDRVRISF